MIKEPVETLSPALTRISFNTPANGAGTSIEALSPSTVINDCSSAILSPTFTIISVTLTSSPPISGTLTSTTEATALAALSACAAGAAVSTLADPAAVSNRIINEPVETLSPAATRISFTTPANGAGTSIEALSPSTVNKDCSSLTVSPTLTMISVTFTSSPPISGTVTSTTALACGALAGWLAGLASCLSAAGTAAVPSKTIIGEPVDTLSPTLTRISFTTPLSGDGTSIEALSPSTLIKLCSTDTLSPTFTIISVTVTSSLPISGT